MPYWLLESSISLAIEKAKESGAAPTAQQEAEYSARSLTASTEGGSRLLTVAGNNAEIKVAGTITKQPSFLAMLFGGGNTTWPEIIAAVAEAEADPAIDNITLKIDSGGGQIDGMFDAMAAVQTAKKPIKAVVSNLAASAAYALASQADSIETTNRAARIGSIGIAATYRVDEDTVDITSSDAPNKRPDVTTPEGRAVVVEELDALHQIFVEAIADGRGTTVDKVNADFGRGGTLLADEALKRGMIDAVAAPALRVVGSATSTTADNGGNQPEADMDLKQLMAQHPDVYAEAVQAGVDQERDRVTAHLIMGEKTGAMKTASEAIREGTGMTATLQAEYLTAGMNRRDVNARQDDDAGADAGNNATVDDPQEGGDTVASLIEGKLGMEV